MLLQPFRCRALPAGGGSWSPHNADVAPIPSLQVSHMVPKVHQMTGSGVQFSDYLVSGSEEGRRGRGRSSQNF